MDAPVLRLGALVVHEPVTVATDLLLAMECAVLVLMLRGGRRPSTRRWTGFFLFLGVATLLGALKHGGESGAPGVMAATLGSDLAGGLSATFAGWSAATDDRPAGHGVRLARRLLLLQLPLFATAVVLLDTFLVVVLQTAAVLVPVMILELFRARRGRPGSGLVFLGLASNVPSAAVYALGLSLGPWVNHNDIAHGLMMVGLVLIGRGVRRAEAGEPTLPPAPTSLFPEALPSLPPGVPPCSTT